MISQNTAMHAYVQGFVPHQTSAAFWLVLTAKCLKIPVIASKWSLDLNMGLEII
jgi:hypothetical protein